MQAIIPVHVLRISCIVLVAVVLGACSSTRLAYRFADQGVLWWVDDYITLTGDQKSALRNDLEALKAWHCETELPRYSAWLGELSQEMADKLSKVWFEGALDLAATKNAEAVEVIRGLATEAGVNG